MRTQSKNSWLIRALPIGLIVLSAVPMFAQTEVQPPAPTPAPAPSPVRRRAPRIPAKRVIVDSNVAAPQVVTILHTLSGLKVIRLLGSKKQIEIVGLDQAFKIAGEVHTNVIAGLALGDGHTIAAWLPEAEAELPPRAVGVAPPVPPAVLGARPSTSVAPPAVAVEASHAPMVAHTINFNGTLLEPADLRVITREGKRITGRYIGLDGLTGLSLITLPGEAMPQAAESSDEAMVVGQKLRVIGPQPVAGQENGGRSPMYIRIAETEAVVVGVTRAPSGGLAKVKIRSAKLSPANIGGIAINEDGETLGIVDSVKGEAATIVPMALVRMAAKRVLARQASVPRPWLGIHGEPIGAMSFERLQRVGWEIERARALADKRQGILLTSVTPNSPAAAAKLKPGDVILSVNNDFIRNAEEFSWLLDEAGPGNPVRFAIARPGNHNFEFDIKLSESPDPFFGLKQRIEESFKFKFAPLFGEGVETVALKPKVAVRLGSSGGLLVVSVEPSSAAFKAGLRAGDVIESINGQPLYSGNATMLLPKTPGTKSTYTVVRNKEKVSISFKYSEDPPGTPEPE